jgi:hypothetical protein
MNNVNCKHTQRAPELGRASRTLTKKISLTWKTSRLDGKKGAHQQWERQEAPNRPKGDRKSVNNQKKNTMLLTRELQANQWLKSTNLLLRLAYKNVAVPWLLLFLLSHHIIELGTLSSLRYKCTTWDSTHESTYSRNDVSPTRVAVGMAAGATNSHLSSVLRMCRR